MGVSMFTYIPMFSRYLLPRNVLIAPRPAYYSISSTKPPRHTSKSSPQTTTRTSHSLEIPRTYPFPHAPQPQILHQRHEARLRFLRRHGGALDGADFFHRFFLRREGKRVDVVEDVGAAGDGEGGSVRGVRVRCGVGGGRWREGERRRVFGMRRS